MPVDVNDADIAVDVRSDPADIGEAEAVIASADDREDARRIDVRYGLGDLIESLFDVARNDKDVAGIAEVQLLVDVNAAIEPVTVIESGDPPNGLGPKPGAWSISGRRIERRADECGFVLTNLADVLALGDFHESIDAGEGRLVAAAEQRDAAVDH